MLWSCVLVPLQVLCIQRVNWWQLGSDISHTAKDHLTALSPDYMTHNSQNYPIVPGNAEQFETRQNAFWTVVEYITYKVIHNCWYFLKHISLTFNNAPRIHSSSNLLALRLDNGITPNNCEWHTVLKHHNSSRWWQCRPDYFNSVLYAKLQLTNKSVDKQTLSFLVALFSSSSAQFGNSYMFIFCWVISFMIWQKNKHMPVNKITSNKYNHREHTIATAKLWKHATSCNV